MYREMCNKQRMGQERKCNLIAILRTWCLKKRGGPSRVDAWSQGQVSLYNLDPPPPPQKKMLKYEVPINCRIKHVRLDISNDDSTCTCLSPWKRKKSAWFKVPHPYHLHPTHLGKYSRFFSR